MSDNLSSVTVLSFFFDRYKIKQQFCLAANIPLKQDPDKLLEVLQNDGYSGNVEDTVNSFMVYISSNVVAAKHRKSTCRISGSENL